MEATSVGAGILDCCFEDESGAFTVDSEGCVRSRCIFRCHPKKIDGDCHLVAVNDIAFHPCNNTFITGDDEGYAIIWDNSSRKRLLEFPKYTRSIGSMSYNHNGQLLAIASGYPDQEASEVWNLVTEGK
ncbi:hypothetical protein QJS10_CPB04g01619 [Acorus calamus]|uniref:Uncharacterized protein n=1 Tax=Acorus calamus TaxID=4465 RepID=A0AAV9F2A1_ACOCL|nr:hypothetical protein QJS10_CPB04g01619 [Acorus calamus]